MGEGQAATGEAVRLQNRGDGRLPVPLPNETNRDQLCERTSHSKVASQSRCTRERSSRENYESSGTIDHVHPVVQCEGANAPVRLAGMVEASLTIFKPSVLKYHT